MGNCIWTSQLNNTKMESSGETIMMIENIEVDIWSSSTRHREKTEMNLEDDNGWADFVLSTKAKVIATCAGSLLFIIFVLIVNLKLRQRRKEKMDPEEVERRKTDDLIGLLSNNESLIRFAN